MIIEEHASECPNIIRLKALLQLVDKAKKIETAPIEKPVYKRIYIGNTLNNVPKFDWRIVRKS